MKLAEKIPDILVSDNFEETTFSFDNASEHIIFDILRKRVYKNAIGSICREIASNGRDSHREAGKPDEPIEIEIMDGRDNFFVCDGLNIVFRDRGVGISPERIKKVYSKYGASTKRLTNDQTGGFGLGAKTPFAYVDAFTVRTIVDGTEYIYSIYIDESKKGKIALLSTEPSVSETNMTEIIVPMEDRDRDTFEWEVKKSTHFWAQRPNLIGFRNRKYDTLNVTSVKGINIPYEKPGEYAIYDSNGFLESMLNVVIDGIYYPVDVRLLGYKDAGGFAIVFFFNNGDISVSANREQLQYDEETINILKEKAEGVFEQFRNYYRAELCGSKTLLQAQVKYSNLNRESLFSLVKGQEEFEFTVPSGASVVLGQNSRVELGTIKVLECETAAIYPSFRIKKDSITNLLANRVMENIENMYLITVEDLKERRTAMLNTINRTIINASHNRKFIIFIEETEEEFKDRTYSDKYSEVRAKDWENINSLGLELKRYYDVVPDKLQPPIRARKETVTLRCFSNGCFTTNNYKFDGGSFWGNGREQKFLYYYSDYEGEFKKNSSASRRLEYLSELVHAIAPNMRIVIASRLKMKYFKNYQSVGDFLNANESQIRRIYDRYIADQVIHNAKTYMDLDIADSLKHDLIAVVSLSSVNYLDLSYHGSILRELLPTFNLDRTKFNKTLENIRNEYPLLSHLSDNQARRKYVSMVNELNELRSLKTNLQTV